MMIPDRDSFLQGVYVGRQLKGWAEEGLEQYHAYGFRNMILDGDWAEQCGYLYDGGDYKFSGYKEDGILVRKNADNVYSITNTDGMLYPDWRKPFEIGTEFSINTDISSGKMSIVFGSNYYSSPSGYYLNEWYSPQAIVHDDRFEFTYASYQNSTLRTYSLELGGSKYPDDYMPIDTDRVYKILYRWTGTQWIVSVSFGRISAKRKMNISVPHLYSTAHTIMFGNNLTKSKVSNPQTIQNLAFNLRHTYIKVDGKLLWGFI